MSFERKKQLGMLDRNLDFTKTLSTNAEQNQQPQMNNQPPQPAADQDFAGQGYQPQPPQGGDREYSQNQYQDGQPQDQPQGIPQRGAVNQSAEFVTRRPAPRTDYDYIKMKNSAWGSKFDIISNKIKDFAK